MWGLSVAAARVSFEWREIRTAALEWGAQARMSVERVDGR